MNVCVSPCQAFKTAFIVLFEPFPECGIRDAVDCAELTKSHTKVILKLPYQELLLKWIKRFYYKVNSFPAE